jgi:hypothetical protein
MISDFIISEQDFDLFEPNIFSPMAEKKLIELILEENFLDNPWLKRRLVSYCMAEAWEKDRLVLDLVKFFLQEKLPSELFVVLRKLDSVFASLGQKGHFIHQFEVFIFGWALIRMLIEHDKSIKKAFRFKSPKEIFTVWLLASVVHDLGFPLQMASDVMAEFSTWYQVLGMTEVAKLYKNLKKDYEISRAKNLKELRLEEWRGLDITTILLKALEETLQIDRSAAKKLQRNLDDLSGVNIHGYTGAIVLCGKCFRSWQTGGLNSATPDFSIASLKLVLAAICLHDLSDTFSRYIKRLNFHHNPYA